MKDVTAYMLFMAALAILFFAVRQNTVLQSIIAFISVIVVIMWPFPKSLAIALYKDIKELITSNNKDHG